MGLISEMRCTWKALGGKMVPGRPTYGELPTVSKDLNLKGAVLFGDVEGGWAAFYYGKMQIKLQN